VSLWGAVLLAVGTALAEPVALAPTDHDLIYYNARMALREGNATEAVKLWLVRNALENQTGRVSRHDADFHSLTWAALGELGICQDGHPTDEDGAGLWPLALQNWFVQNRTRELPPPAPTFPAFEAGRQARYVSIGDVIGRDELRALELARGPCLQARLAFLQSQDLVFADLKDRKNSSMLLAYLLRTALRTLDADRVRGRAAVAARLFEVELQLAAIGEAEARAAARRAAARTRRLRLGRATVQAVREEAPTSTLEKSTRAAQILAGTVDWSVGEWMTLSPDRRVFLFDTAKAYVQDPVAFDEIAQGILDALITAGDGNGVMDWVDRAAGPTHERAWEGERGERMLSLDADSGFSERSVIALHRGIQLLEQGAQPEALRAMAYAMSHAAESSRAEDVAGLSRRWMSHVAGQFKVTDTLLVTLRQLLEPRDYGVILEDLVWHSALRADYASYQRGVANQLGRGALERRVAALQPLAAGNVNRFHHELQTGMRSAPSETLRFLVQLVQRLEREDASVRAAHVPTLDNIRRLLERKAAQEQEAGHPARALTALVEQAQAIVEGVDGLTSAASVSDRARSLDPNTEVFAGSVRLAPADAVPWPFESSRVGPPSVYSPLKLTPVEWLGPDGAWVFGWRITG